MQLDACIFVFLFYFGHICVEAEIVKFLNNNVHVDDLQNEENRL